MTKLENDLYSLGRSFHYFYGALTAIIVALPLVDRTLVLLPPVLGQRTAASVAGTIAAIALIGHDYLHPKDPSIHGIPTGAVYLIAGVLLTIGYVAVAELVQQRLPLSPVLDTAFIVWYVILYSVFALGMWKMAWRAYRTRDKEISLPIGDTLPN
jgi:hypothetical protein